MKEKKTKKTVGWVVCLVLILGGVLIAMGGCERQKKEVPPQKPAVEQPAVEEPAEQEAPEQQSLKEHSFFVASEEGVRNGELNEEQWKLGGEGEYQQEEGEYQQEEGEGEYWKQPQE